MTSLTRCAALLLSYGPCGLCAFCLAEEDALAGEDVRCEECGALNCGCEVDAESVCDLCGESLVRCGCP